MGTEKRRGTKRIKGRGVGLTPRSVREGEEVEEGVGVETGNTVAIAVTEQGSISLMTGLTRGKAELPGIKTGGINMTTGGTRRNTRKEREWKEIIIGDEHSILEIIL